MVDARYSDLVEIAKCSGDLKKSYGAAVGGLLTGWLAWLAHLANRPQPILRGGWLLAGVSALYGV